MCLYTGLNRNFNWTYWYKSLFIQFNSNTRVSKSQISNKCAQWNIHKIQIGKSYLTVNLLYIHFVINIIAEFNWSGYFCFSSLLRNNKHAIRIVVDSIVFFFIFVVLVHLAEKRISDFYQHDSQSKPHT